MKLEDIEKMAQELRVLAYYPDEYKTPDVLDKLLAVAEAAAYLDYHMERSNDCECCAFNRGLKDELHEVLAKLELEVSDAQFIAASRDLIPKLLAVVKAAKNQLKQIPSDPNYDTSELEASLEELER